MKDTLPDLNQRIAARVHELRTSQGISLDALATRSGVSRSMISLIERGESSPTAVVLDKLAAGLGVILASLFDAASTAPASPLARQDDQPTWQDPASGYLRRNVTPGGLSLPFRIVEVLFPPRKRVTFEAGSRGTRPQQQIWVLEGSMDITLESERYRLAEGDCLAMSPGLLTIFYNPTRKLTRYMLATTAAVPR